MHVWPFLSFLLVLGASAAPVADPSQTTPAATLAKWLTAMEKLDYVAYLDCIHHDAHRVPEYGSREAMRFWAKQVEDLKEKGFAGEFKVVPTTQPDARHPPGSVRAYPVLKDGRTAETVLLMLTPSGWRIVRAFS
jgi:hypothetical protein